MDYTKQTCKELKDLCKKNGVKGYSKMKKAELVEVLTNPPSSSQTVILEPQAPSYLDFFTRKSKAENDAVNKRREIFLCSLYDRTLALDAPDQEKQLQNAWRSAVNSLCSTPFTRVEITRIGGRKNNFDLLFDYYDGETRVHQQNVEFKHGVSAITALPQILSLASKDLTFPQSYAEFYYDRYLPKYVALDSGITVSLPEKAVYMKHIHSSKYDSHPFFRCLYSRRDDFKEEKEALVYESIRVYLEENAASINIRQVSELLCAKQKGKVFLLWDMKTFHVEELTDEDLTAVESLGVRNNNMIVLKTATRTLKLLLRWKNTKGAMYPAWQIAVARA
jgi:hypothetical protein